MESLFLGSSSHGGFTGECSGEVSFPRVRTELVEMIVGCRNDCWLRRRLIVDVTNVQEKLIEL